MKIGDILVICDNSELSRAKLFIEIRVTESRKVNMMWGKGQGNGYRAEDVDGKKYQCNWDSFPDDSMTPEVGWFSENEKKFYYDTEQSSTSNLRQEPEFVKKFKSLKWCDKHKKILHVDRICWNCEMDKKIESIESPIYKPLSEGK